MQNRIKTTHIFPIVVILLLGACTPAVVQTQPATDRPSSQAATTAPPTELSVITLPGEATQTPASAPPTAIIPQPTDNGAAENPVNPGTEMIPLIDMVNGENYLGFEGGLYPGGTNEMPAEHFTEGLERAALIQPLDVNGNPSPNGKIVLLTVGMSHVHLETCDGGQINSVCPSISFIGQADADPAVDQSNLFIFNGARGSLVAEKWIGTGQYIYEWIDANFAQLGLSRLQVQAVWLKQANLRPRASLPASQADAYELMKYMGEIVRTLSEIYPNLQMVFFSSRTYAGYTSYALNPEPYAYESGFAVKWLIEAQIEQMAGGGGQIEPIAGDLNYDAGMPWLAWGPYLWANGSEPRSDGLIWTPEDFNPQDLTHPSEGGIQKVARLVLDFFMNSPHTRCWFLTNGTCSGN